MSAASAALAGRQAAEAAFEDTFTAYAPDGRTTDANGIEVPAYATRGTTPGKIAGPGKLPTTRPARTVAVAGVDRPVILGGLHIPIAAPVPAIGEHGIGWEYVLSTPGDATDPSLAGSRWLVVGAEEKSCITARRLDVVRLS